MQLQLAYLKAVASGAQIRGGGGGQGNMSPEGGGHNIKCPPPPPTILGWMIIKGIV